MDTNGFGQIGRTQIFHAGQSPGGLQHQSQEALDIIKGGLSRRGDLGGQEIKGVLDSTPLELFPQRLEASLHLFSHRLSFLLIVAYNSYYGLLGHY